MTYHGIGSGAPAASAKVAAVFIRYDGTPAFGASAVNSFVFV